MRVIIPTYSIQTDSDRFENPLQWDGFRFSRPREAFNASQQAKISGDKNRLDKVLELKNQALISTSDDFFTFGAVRHACKSTSCTPGERGRFLGCFADRCFPLRLGPGRFFASQEMKLMIAYVAMTYDIKIEGGRPKNLYINGASVPRDEATMQIRLRAQ